MTDEHRVAVVTGGTYGIGLDVVKTFLDAGYKTAFFGRSAEKVSKNTAELINVYGDDNVLSATLDIADTQSLSKFWKEVDEKWNGASVLVNNAGISPKENGIRTPLHKIPIDEWNQVLAVNLTGAFCCTQFSLPRMVERGYGRVVMIGSIANRALPQLAGASYVASKGGLTSLMNSIVAEYSEYGITANTVCPGSIATTMLGNLDTKANRNALKRIPVNRFGSATEIASTVKFLCSEEASFINGASVDVNGGEYISS